MEFLKKNKYALIAAAFLAVAVVAGLGKVRKPAEPAKPACVQVAQQELEVLAFFCAQQLDVPTVKKELCLSIKGTEECLLSEQEDGAAIQEFILLKISPCINENLEKSGFCPFEFN